MREDGLGIDICDVSAGTTSLVTLPFEAANVMWNRQGTTPTILASDGSVWWVPDPAIYRVEQLTPPLPEVRDVKWTPSGTHLAFVGGKDIYVVEVRSP